MFTYSPIYAIHLRLNARGGAPSLFGTSRLPPAAAGRGTKDGPNPGVKWDSGSDLWISSHNNDQKAAEKRCSNTWFLYSMSISVYTQWLCQLELVKPLRKSRSLTSPTALRPSAANPRINTTTKQPTGSLSAAPCTYMVLRVGWYSNKAKSNSIHLGSQRLVGRPKR